jgi:hypothetical protein
MRADGSFRSSECLTANAESSLARRLSTSNSAGGPQAISLPSYPGATEPMPSTSRFDGESASTYEYVGAQSCVVAVTVQP